MSRGPNRSRCYPYDETDRWACTVIARNLALPLGRRTERRKVFFTPHPMQVAARPLVRPMVGVLEGRKPKLLGDAHRARQCAEAPGDTSSRSAPLGMACALMRSISASFSAMRATMSASCWTTPG
jgi:hypothetical protein